MEARQFRRFTNADFDKILYHVEEKPIELPLRNLHKFALIMSNTFQNFLVKIASLPFVGTVLFCASAILPTLVYSQSNGLASGVLTSKTLTTEFAVNSHQPHFPFANASELSSRKASSVGRRVPDFVLTDVNGKATGFSDFGDSRYAVVVFLGTQCPIGNAYVPLLSKLQKKFADKSVKVIGINANLQDSANDIKKHVNEFKIKFPVLIDSDQASVDLFGATRTPEVFVLDRRRNIRYQGRIDDRFGYSFKKTKATRDDLEIAIQELVDGKEISVAETKPLGCLITRKSNLKSSGDVTYTQDIAKIINNRCVECHHAGTAAPFELDSYEHAKNWSEMIKEVVQQRRMPPWEADPRYGKFKNDLRMNQDEIDTLVAWIDNGAPYGDKKDMPKLKGFPAGWTIDKPDKTFKMPTEYTVQADGVVEYQRFVTPTNFTEDVWIQASEARPGNRAAVHHIIVYVREKGSNKRSGLPAIAGFAPGEEPMVFPKGTGYRIPAGAELVWEVHYTPTGKVEKDRCEVGLIFCKEPPERSVEMSLAINQKFVIPAGAENHPVIAKRSIVKDVELISLMPHMHLRGKSFKYEAIFPDGKKETLLSVPNYDFNWQHRYRFAKPKFLPRGTVIECTAHYDNSSENPANPEATKPVRWGDQTFEEMMIGFFSYVPAEKK